MKVVVAHNHYRSAAPSGENQMVGAETALLEAAGVTVLPFMRHSDELAGASALRKVGAAIGPVYAPTAVSAFKELLAEERPDLVHVHNVFPLLSPWIVRIARDRGLPVVQTVHNYRHTCLNGLHVRDGRRCDDCVGKRVPWPGVVHACYRGSRMQSVPMAASQAVHRSTWEGVNAYLALTPFMAERLELAGIPRDRIVVRPSWVPDPGPTQPPGRDFAYVGRLDEAKGVRVLLDAWRRHPPADRVLQVAGDGPLRDELAQAASGIPSLRYLGPLGPDGVSRLMASSAAVVIPSVFYEGFPLTLAEAFAHGRPVVVTAGSSCASVVTDDTGWVAPLDADALAATFRGMTAEEVATRGAGARRFYDAHLSPASGTESLLRVYGRLLQPTGR